MERTTVQRGGDVSSWGGGGGGGDMPDSVDVLDSVADLLAKLLLIKFHLQRQKGKGI